MTPSKRLALGIAGFAMISALAACSKAPPAVDPAKETAAINAENDAINAAIKAKDADKTVAYDADEISSWATGAPAVLSKAEDLAGDKAAFADPAYTFSYKADRTDIAASGDIAYQSGNYTQTDTNPTTHKVETLSGNWVAGWKKAADGSWKLAAVAAVAPTPAKPS